MDAAEAIRIMERNKQLRAAWEAREAAAGRRRRPPNPRVVARTQARLAAEAARRQCVWPGCSEQAAQWVNRWPEPHEIGGPYAASPMCLEHLYGAWRIAQDIVDEANDNRRLVDIDEALGRRRPSQIDIRKVTAPRASKPQPRKPGTIYYLRCDGFIKVGYASSLTRRMRQYPPSSVLLAVRPGSQADEYSEHDLLREHRAWRKEWYHPVQPVMDRIDWVIEQFGPLPDVDPEEYAAMLLDEKRLGKPQ